VNDFENWWIDFCNYVGVNMSIYLNVSHMHSFSKYFQQGLSVDDAAKRYYKNCVTCGKVKAIKTMKTCMHNGMHGYVCNSKCMVDFYK